MTNVEIAKELVRIANKLSAADSDEFKKIDPKMNAIVTKVVNETNGDLSDMLTIIIMALRKTGHSAEANKVFQQFKTLLKKVDVAA